MQLILKLKAFILIVFLILPSLSFSGSEGKIIDNDGSKLRIISPENGTIVGDTVEILYELQKGTQADHVHAYVDGKYQKGFKGILNGLSKGRHEIVLKVANSDHDIIAVSAKTIVEVR